MLNREAEEQLSDILVKRINDANAKILEKIGSSLKAFNTIKPTEANQLAQILKYGGSYEAIAKELAKASGKNVADIYKIFQQVARDNKYFAEAFYKYRGMDFIPYEKDLPLQSQVKALANITNNTYKNIANSNVVGYMYQDTSGHKTFKNLKDTYYDLIDRAVLNISQGKTTFDEGINEALKQIGTGGLVVYESGKTRRLDSAVRMNVQDSIRQFNQELTKQYGAQYGADGVEISVHAYPAPDHADAQGKQFYNDEYMKLQQNGIAKTVKNEEIDLHMQLKSRTAETFRQIGQYNCYHRTFNIIVGVSKPLYTDEQLQKIKDDNEKGFEFEGKHYTLYEGTQLQRNLETAIRGQKDTQILAKASGNMQLVEESQNKIKLLNKKYKALCNASGLPAMTDNMRVSGYKRTAVPKLIKEPEKPVRLSDEELDEEYLMYWRDLIDKDVAVDIKGIEDKELRNKQIRQLDTLTNEYEHNINSPIDKLVVNLSNKKANTYGTADYYGHQIQLNRNHFTTEKNVVEKESRNIKTNWHYKVKEENIPIYTTTHEYGHILEYEYIKRIRKNGGKFTEADNDLKDILITETMRKLKTKMTKTEFKEKYWSRYAKSKRNYEWFAETFAKYKLGEQDEWTETFGEWLEGYFNGR